MMFGPAKEPKKEKQVDRRSGKAVSTSTCPGFLGRDQFGNPNELSQEQIDFEEEYDSYPNEFALRRHFGPRFSPDMGGGGGGGIMGALGGGQKKKPAKEK